MKTVLVVLLVLVLVAVPFATPTVVEAAPPAYLENCCEEGESGFGHVCCFIIWIMEGILW